MKVLHAGISEMFTDYCRKRLTMSDDEIIHSNLYTQEQIDKFKAEAYEVADIKGLIKLGIGLSVGFCILLVASYLLMDWYDSVNNFSFIIVDYVMFMLIALGAFIQSGFALLGYIDIRHLERHNVSIEDVKSISETTDALSSLGDEVA